MSLSREMDPKAFATLVDYAFANKQPDPSRSPSCRVFENAFFAEVGGVKVTELNTLEVDLLFGLQFSLNVSEAELESTLQGLANQRRSRKRARDTPLPSFQCRTRLNTFLESSHVQISGAGIGLRCNGVICS